MLNAPPLDGHCGVIVTNQEQAYQHLIKIMQNAKTQLCAFLSPYTLVITTDSKQVKSARLAARARGVNLRYITQITRENIEYCKKQIGMVTELRHLDNIAGNFIISESEIGAAPVVSAKYPISYGYYSNVAGVLSLYQGLFETFWQCAIPAQVKIRELEGGKNKTGKLPSIVNSQKQRVLIDRFYFCKQCPWTSIFKEERLSHERHTGHQKIHEFPIFE